MNVNLLQNVCVYCSYIKELLHTPYVQYAEIARNALPPNFTIEDVFCRDFKGPNDTYLVQCYGRQTTVAVRE